MILDHFLELLLDKRVSPFPHLIVEIELEKKKSHVSNLGLWKYCLIDGASRRLLFKCIQDLFDEWPVFFLKFFELKKFARMILAHGVRNMPFWFQQKIIEIFASNQEAKPDISSIEKLDEFILSKIHTIEYYLIMDLFKSTEILSNLVF